MTATDKLRRLLDERWVEHYDGWSGEIRYTKWKGNYGMWFLTHDSFGTDGELLYVQGINMTPEQAVAATLGSGECEIETTENWLPAERYHRCRHCGAFFAVMNASWDIQPCACPNCGKAVKR